MAADKKGRITIYVDCVSPYSFFGFTNAVNFRPQLAAHGIHLNIQPFFLGAARHAAGNPFSPTPAAKIPFSSQDTATTGRLLGLKVVQPEVFPVLSLLPVRIATWVKDHYDDAKFDATFKAFASGYWSKNINISTNEGVFQALNGIFPKEEIALLLQKAVTPENKKKVVDVTLGIGNGAFGAPWILGVNVKGERKDWFGNDRWDQVFEHMGVPYRPVTILSPEEAKAKAKAKL